MKCQRSLEELQLPRRQCLRGRSFLENYHAVAQRRHSVGGKAPFTKAVTHQWFVDEAHTGAVENEPKQAIPVVSDRDRIVIAAQCEKTVAADRRRKDETPLEHCPALVDDWKRVGRAEPSNRSQVDFEQCVRRNDVEVWSRPDELTECLEASRKEGVIRIEDRDEISLRLRCCSVQGGGTASICLSNHDDPFSVRRERTVQIIGRAVVTDDDLGWRHGLVQRRGNGIGDSVGRLVGADQDGKARGRSAAHAVDGRGQKGVRLSYPARRVLHERMVVHRRAEPDVANSMSYY